ncbi:hypothetical protein BS47DRAFT_433806 [Hydnum rufescens UP504]|uniref:Uncharacterized protein n=1 Tax=Hydnum rufescens UP504 TaxID=1448309 RepID=A0A9P6AIC9_9AGAM|nr:hypothetical protein BS47DRAFT_433806 [Hydnum rufescens UP504]
MDYRDLILLQGPLDHSLFQQLDFGEALRFLFVSLKVTRIEDPDTPGLVDPRRPTIHFRGTSNLRAPNESSVYGTVSVTPEGDIRWFMVSTFGGEDRWQSTGVQIGGVGSAMGVMGTWSGFDHHERDPAGPYWLWRIG